VATEPTPPLKPKLCIGLALACLFPLACTVHPDSASNRMAKPASANERIFELRTYTASPGKLDALNARFREHTNALFEKHGMTVIGFFTPLEGDRRNDTLVYILAFPDRAARDASWKAFRDDPEWVRVKAESEVNGSLTVKIESVVLGPTDYSPIR